MAMTHAQRQARYILRKQGKLPPRKQAMTPLERNRKYRYGITPEEFNALLEKQKGKCAICSGDRGNRQWHVDHNHKTNKVRSILCHRCNILVGYIESNLNILDIALDYIIQ